MDDSRRTVQSLLFRRGIWSAIVTGCAGTLGYIAARPLFGAFHNSAPWLFPVVEVGALAVLVLVALVLLPWITRRA